MEREYGHEVDVAVRSSATAEDLPTASFAGQQETYLNIRGIDNLLATCHQVFASLFTDRAITYRVHQGFDHKDVALSIGVQKMVRSDVGASGVMFTLDTESGFRDVVFITSAYGLGENLKRHRGGKEYKLVYTTHGRAGLSTRNVHTTAEERRHFSITDEEVLELAKAAVIIERHYSGRAGESRPMDIEWAKDGVTGELFIVQARPETVQSQDRSLVKEVYHLRGEGEVLLTGKAVGSRAASGKARSIFDARQMEDLQPGEILVTDMTDPDWEPVMKRAGAIVTNRGGRTCHAAIIARELGIPAVVGTGHATEVLQDGMEVTVSCAEGDAGVIYAGALPIEIERIDLSQLERPKTKLMVNLANPDRAFGYSSLPAEGVGLMRLEFIINHGVRIHPRALLEDQHLTAHERHEIEKITAGYPSHRDFYIQRIAEGVGMIAASFYPRPVIVRLSDFKSNEYAALIGGKHFEPVEENPMLGFRGASRYFSAEFADAFALECQALRYVREDMGLDNVQVMVPFVRTVTEGCAVLEEMAKNGLRRGEQGLKVFIMCEIPANALMADEFLEHFDGFSIGSNDMTQLTLGVDRDSGLLTGYDERNPAVLKMLELAIAACRRHGKYVGICGQAPSDFPEITRWLVEQGIESISLNPDSLLAMQQIVLEAEKARDG